MRTGAIFRVRRGSSIYIAGGAGVATALFWAAVWGTVWIGLVVAFGALCILLFFGFFIAWYFMTKRRLQELREQSIGAGEVVVDGNYTNPRTWGVYKVEEFKNGTRGTAFHLGNHPVRQNELVREHGAAELVLLFTSRIDAEELKHLLNTGRVSAS